MFPLIIVLKGVLLQHILPDVSLCFLQRLLETFHRPNRQRFAGMINQHALLTVVEELWPFGLAFPDKQYFDICWAIFLPQSFVGCFLFVHSVCLYLVIDMFSSNSQTRRFILTMSIEIVSDNK